MTDSINELLAEVKSRMDLPSRSRVAREACGVSLPRMAAAIGVSATALWHWENGSRHPRRPAVAKWEQAVAALEAIHAVHEPDDVVRDIFGARIANGLLRSGIRTLRELSELSENDLLRIPNFGQGSLIEVRHAMACCGLLLAETDRVPPFTGEHLRLRLYTEAARS